MTRTALTTVAIFCTLLLAGVMVAGPLTPPAGPVTDTGRFGTQIELNQTNTPGNAEALFVITQPGSYVLTGNANAGNRSGIHVGASNVTIDLNGHTLSGDRSPESKGIAPIPSQTNIPDFENIEIRNGAVRSYEEGINTSNALFFPGGLVITEMRFVRMHSLRVTDTQRGIRHLAGGTIASSVVEGDQTGITASSCAITDCYVRSGGTASSVGVSGNNINVSDTTVSITAGTPGGSPALGFSVANSILRGCNVAGDGRGFDLDGDTVANTCVASVSGAEAIFELTVTIVDCNF